ncbi:DUF6526 family protein [Paenibacillus koleovorans]|uniref:DUF6526 family protein n=1 Tax=Paenibacillus koleovorans TaxID=121608 RepID=UPI000FD7A3FF|nr:DUF6526 family protein [Paenibacillus koleovorans]
MQPAQTYANHRRIHPLYHFVLSLLTLLVLIGSIMWLVQSLGDEETRLLPSLLAVGFAVCFVVLFLIVRGYAAKVQDRAIRAEEKLRHYILTGKPLDNRLTIKQIVALRFASDEEFPALCRRAVLESLEPVAIKQAVRTWRADHDRV